MIKIKYIVYYFSPYWTKWERLPFLITHYRTPIMQKCGRNGVFSAKISELNMGILAGSTILHNASVLHCVSCSKQCPVLWITYPLLLQTMSIWYKIKVMDAKWTGECVLSKNKRERHCGSLPDEITFGYLNTSYIMLRVECWCELWRPAPEN